MSSAQSSMACISGFIKNLIFCLCMIHFVHCSFKLADWSVPVEQINTVYDYIIVGAGSAGCRLANKLSENSSLMILVLEAGSTPPDYNEIPGFASVADRTEYDWNIQPLSQQYSSFAYINQKKSCTCGKVVGGTSVLNYLLYQRGNRYDYDNWQSTFGATGWDFDNVLPLYMADEANSDPSVSSTVHGRNGNLCVSPTKWRTPLLTAFLEGGQSLGYEIDDVLDGNNTGFFEFQTTTCNGVIRCSAAKAFIQSIVGIRKNLHLSLKSMVTKILFDGQRASGVTFDRDGKTHNVYAAREIILSAGAFKTPQLLMLSGIGPKDQLDNLNIPVIADLSVGENLQDHAAVFALFGAGPLDWQMDMTDSNALIEYYRSSTGPLTSSSGTHFGVGYVTTKYASNNVPDIEVFGYSAVNTLLDVNVYPEYLMEYFGPVGAKGMYYVVPSLLHPQSKGWVRLNTTSIYDDPLVNQRYLAEKLDVDRLVEGLKISADIIRSKPFQDLNITIYEVPFPTCKNYSFGSDDYMRCLAQQMTFGIWHPCGTCRMGDVSRNDTVVDSRLRVKGVERLRIADASVIPQIISGHLNSVCIMIGSKAGDLILEDMLPRIEPGC